MESQTCTANKPSLRIVITGGSAGIGREMVQVFAKAGHKVLFTYLHSIESAKELVAKNPGTTMTRLDQGDINSVAEFGAAVADWAAEQGVDVLINNAALGSATVRRYVDASLSQATCSQMNGTVRANGQKEQPLYDLLRKAAEDEALMRVNALGPLWVTDTIIPHIHRATTLHDRRRDHATIIFVGSVGGGSAAVFPEYRPADLMGKAAMTYLSKHLAAEHVRDAVDVMCVSPGATETDMFRESTLSKLSNIQMFVDGMPKRKLIQPNSLAETMMWLVTSEAARVFHGAVLDASMGLAVRPGLQTEARIS